MGREEGEGGTPGPNAGGRKEVLDRERKGRGGRRDPGL